MSWCNLWNLDSGDVKNTINRGLRKGNKKGLDMKEYETIIISLMEHSKRQKTELEH